jgi:thiamine-monophosphate kinase
VTNSAGEFALIEWIRQRAATHANQAVGIGIGDDAAALRLSPSAEMLVTVDVLLEGVHFKMPPATPVEVGRKALAVNLSDIAAMAGQPVAAVVGIACPRDGGIDLPRELHEGMQTLADEFKVAIVGGDTNIWDGPLVVSVTLFGEATGSGPVRRDSARPGDWIMTTGSFGGSLAGQHFTFQPRLLEALALHRETSLHAMLDVSDGLAADLHHILDESHVGAILQADEIPISEAARLINDGRTPLEHALSDGEDFELLFTVSPEEGRQLLGTDTLGTPISHIGEIIDGSGCRLVHGDGSETNLPRLGWEHGFAETDSG